MEEKLYKNKIVRLDKPLEHFTDIDEQTAEKLRHNFKTELITLQYVERGELKELKKFMDENSFEIYLGYSGSQFGNERAFTQRALSLASNAAINGGVDCVVVYSVLYKYQNLIESTADSKKLLGLVAEILITFCQLVGYEVYKKRQSPVLLPVLRYIHSNVNKKISVITIAAKMNMNANYLSRLFKSEMKQNITDYIIEIKMNYAKNLMSTTDMSLLQISNYLCFSSQSYFNNVFKKTVGVTPKEYLMTVKNI